MTNPNKEPLRIKAGRGVRANIWSNSGKNGEWYNVEIIRTYKDSDGKLQDSKSFSRDDLPHVVYVTQRAFDYILDLTNEHENA